VSGGSFRILETAAPSRERRLRDAVRPGTIVYRAEDGFEVFLPEAILARLACWSRSKAPNEWIGIVIAKPFVDDEGDYLFVLGIIPDEQAIAAPTTVRTTLEGEARMQQLAALLFPDGDRYGWAHSHPGYGTTFSGTDRENQTRWTHPNSVGIVVDHTAPRGQELGLYRGPEATRLTRLIPRSTAPQAPAPRKETPAVANEKRPPRKRRLAGAALVGLVLLTLLITNEFLFMRDQLEVLALRLERLEAAAASLPTPRRAVEAEPLTCVAQAISPAPSASSSALAAPSPPTSASVHTPKRKRGPTAPTPPTAPRASSSSPVSL
jgi:proteasome lid subunit RPN8/RPN11